MIRVEDILPAPEGAICRECAELADWRLLTTSKKSGHSHISLALKRADVDLCTPCRRAGVKGLPLSIRIIKVAEPQVREVRRIDLTPPPPIAPPATPPPAEEEDDDLLPLPESTPEPPAPRQAQEETRMSKKTTTPAESAADASPTGYHAEGSPDYDGTITITFGRTTGRRSTPMTRPPRSQWTEGLCVLQDCERRRGSEGLCTKDAKKAGEKGVLHLLSVTASALTSEGEEAQDTAAPAVEPIAFEVPTEGLAIYVVGDLSADELSGWMGHPGVVLVGERPAVAAAGVYSGQPVEVVPLGALARLEERERASLEDAAGVRLVFDAAITGQPLEAALVGQLPLTQEAVSAWGRAQHRLFEALTEAMGLSDDPDGPGTLAELLALVEPVGRESEVDAELRRLREEVVRLQRALDEQELELGGETRRAHLEGYREATRDFLGVVRPSLQLGAAK